MTRGVINVWLYSYLTFNLMSLWLTDLLKTQAWLTWLQRQQTPREAHLVVHENK